MQIIGSPQPVPTQDGYVPALTLDQDVEGALSYVIANASAIIQLRAAQPRAGPELPWGPEILRSPETNQLRKVSGVRFRSAQAGKPALVLAQLTAPEDPDLSGGTPFTQQLQASGAVGIVGVVDRVGAARDIFGDNTEQTLYNFNLAAGQLAPNAIIELRLGGDYLHNAGAGDTLRLKVWFGLTTGTFIPIYDTTDTLGGAASGFRQQWDLYVRLQNLGVANAQSWAGNLNVEPTSGTLPAVGLGNLAQAAGSWKELPIGLGPGAYVFDTTQPTTLRVTVQWSAASGSNSWALRNGYLEIK